MAKSKKQAAPKGAPKADAPKTEEVKKGGGMFPADGRGETFRLREIEPCHIQAQLLPIVCSFFIHELAHMQGVLVCLRHKAEHCFEDAPIHYIPHGATHVAHPTLSFRILAQCSLSYSSHTLFQHNSHRGGEAFFIVCSFPLGNRRAHLLLLWQSGGEGQISEPHPGGVHVPPVHGHRIAALWSAQAGITRLAK